MIRWLIIGSVMVMALPLALILLIGASPAMSLAAAGISGGPSVLALAAIPPDYLALYLGAARTGPCRSRGMSASCWAAA